MRPSQLGPYRITDEIARGGMGAVYQAWDPRLERVVAIKLLLKGAMATPTQRERFQREVKALAKLLHPNIVAVHAAGEQDGLPYVVMDLVEGLSLEARLEEGPLPQREAAGLVLDLADALQFAHERGVVHRDVKPSNVLLPPDGRCQLTDFGLAKDLGEDSQDVSKSGMFLGTPRYWAPEQARGRLAEIGPRSDVYGLGATLYAAICGRPPIDGGSLIEIIVNTEDEFLTW